MPGCGFASDRTKADPVARGRVAEGRVQVVTPGQDVVNASAHLAAEVAVVGF